jgi:hypothetical protein
MQLFNFDKLYFRDMTRYGQLMFRTYGKPSIHTIPPIPSLCYVDFSPFRETSTWDTSHHLTQWHSTYSFSMFTSSPFSACDSFGYCWRKNLQVTSSFDSVDGKRYPRWADEFRMSTTQIYLLSCFLGLE